MNTSYFMDTLKVDRLLDCFHFEAIMNNAGNDIVSIYFEFLTLLSP